MIQNDIINEAEKLAKKFVAKVDDGRAKSKETYEECKKLLAVIEFYKEYEIREYNPSNFDHLNLKKR
jgi:hypothetical protein